MFNVFLTQGVTARLVICSMTCSAIVSVVPIRTVIVSFPSAQSSTATEATRIVFVKWPYQWQGVCVCKRTFRDV